MHDSQVFRSDIDGAAEKLASRGFQLDVAMVSQLEAERKALQVETQELQSERNRVSKEIGRAKAAGEDVAAIMQSVADLGDRLKQLSGRLENVQQELEDYLSGIPNFPDESVPQGKDERDNVVLRSWGEPAQFDFEPRDHVDLGEGLGGMDFDAAARITGSRFVVLRGPLARLHRALTQFMLDLHGDEHGYSETYVPYIVNAGSLYGTGQLPKFEQDLFPLRGDEGYYLIPTAEVPVTNLARERILEDAELPLKMVAHTPCFRSEAGSYGRDTRGMIRQHQFEKVELVQLVRPEESTAALEQLTGHAEAVLQRLGLPYRAVARCRGDLGFSATRTIDLEVWLPGQQAYREISSCSSFGAFQARRMQARWRNPATGKPEPLHTLNGSGLAVGRCLVAVLENYQNKTGEVRIPDALVDYMGVDKLVPGN